MILRYVLGADAIADVSAELFPHGRKIDWEMEEVGNGYEQLTLQSDDLDLHERILKLCQFTNQHNRDKLSAAVNKRDKRLAEQAKRDVIRAKIEARRQAGYYPSRSAILR